MIPLGVMAAGRVQASGASGITATYGGGIAGRLETSRMLGISGYGTHLLVVSCKRLGGETLTLDGSVLTPALVSGNTRVYLEPFDRSSATIEWAWEGATEFLSSAYLLESDSAPAITGSSRTSVAAAPGSFTAALAITTSTAPPVGNISFNPKSIGGGWYGYWGDSHDSGTLSASVGTNGIIVNIA